MDLTMDAKLGVELDVKLAIKKTRCKQWHKKGFKVKSTNGATLDTKKGTK